MSLELHKHIGTVAYMGGIMSLPEPFTWSLANMMMFSQEALCPPGHHLHLDRTSLSLHDWARNDLLAKMRGEWILMLDTDIAFEPDLLVRLYSTMVRNGADVVTGIYCYKAEPHFPVLYMHNSETDRMEIVGDWSRDSEVFEVDGAGAGVLLVRRAVFERITSELKEGPFDRIGTHGEDHSFFRRCRQLGIKPLCAWKCEVQHLAYLGLRPSLNYKPDPLTFNKEFPFEQPQRAAVEVQG